MTTQALAVAPLVCCGGSLSRSPDSVISGQRRDSWGSECGDVGTLRAESGPPRHQEFYVNVSAPCAPAQSVRCGSRRRERGRRGVKPIEVPERTTVVNPTVI